MTTEKVSKPTGQKDDYEDIIEPSTWTLQGLIDLKAKHYGRFDYTLHNSGLIADVVYTNYDKDGTKFKRDKTKGYFLLQERVEKQVVVE